MHELSVCQGLITEVLEMAKRRGAKRVESIVLQVGTLAGVEPSLLADAFPFVSAGTPAEGAELVIETLPVRVRCPACGAETEALPHDRACRVCGERNTEIIAGDEVRLVKVELSRPETATTLH